MHDLMAETKPEPLLSYRGLAWPVLRTGFRPLLAYGIVWRLVFLLLLGPLTLGIVNSLIALSGEPSVGNLDLISFGLSPLGISTVVIWASLTLASLFMERAGVCVILARLIRGQP